MRRRTRLSFGLRLGLSLVLTLCVTGALTLVMAGSRSEETFLTAAARGHRSDAYAIGRAYWSRTGAGSAMGEVDQAVATISGRPDVRLVELVGEDRRVVAASDPGLKGRRLPRGEVALRRGELSRAAIERVDGGRRVVLVTPLVMGGEPMVLRSEESTTALDRAHASAFHAAALSPLIGLLVGVPLFFALGGRALLRAHRTALAAAHVDGLTGLPNHRAFQDDLSAAFAVATRGGRPLSLALMDIDDFKLSNDRHGHPHGDQLLVALGRQLRGGRAGDRAFRVGGDEFALLLPETDAAGAREALERLVVAACDVGVRLSVGVASLEAGTADDEELWERADDALYRAKRTSEGIASAGAVASHPRAADARRALHELLETKAIDCALQPIWDLRTDAVLGFEALARPRKDLGFTDVGALFDLADRSGKARELDALCRQRALDRAGELPPGVLLFVNVVPQSLEHDALDGGRLALAVREAGLTPEQVVLEISERPTGRRGAMVEAAVRLREHGFRLAIDDVGAGHADLGLLRALPIDFVKIDREVVRSATDDIRARSVLAAILAFAGQTDALVIAEGIENESMLEYVRGLSEATALDLASVHGGQGFHLGRPALGALEPVPSAGLRQRTAASG